MYEVFIRNWWKKEDDKLVPDPNAVKLHVCYTKTIKKAREVCKAYNEKNPKGLLSRKAEFREI